MKHKLILIIVLIPNLYGSGGYDHGSAAGKGILDLSFTLNPFKYFDNGQSYVVVGYGLTNKFDLHGYYSVVNNKYDNYYLGLFYQFYNSKKIDLSTAIGFRKFKNNTTTHLFYPQLLYTIGLNNKLSIGGSIVNVRNANVKINYGYALDIFLRIKIYENKKYDIDFTLGAFKPASWAPLKNNLHPTYSIDIKIK